MSERFVLGLGAASLATLEDARALVDAVLAEAGIGRDALAAMATLDRRADHPVLLLLAAELGLPLTGVSPRILAGVQDRLETPSAAVAARSGLHGVAEGAALVLAGEQGRLLCAKRIQGGVTAALASSPA